MFIFIIFSFKVYSSLGRRDPGAQGCDYNAMVVGSIPTREKI